MKKSEKKPEYVKKIVKYLVRIVHIVFYKLQWLTRGICLKVISEKYKHDRSGTYIDNNVMIGFISDKGKEIMWGKQYHKLYFLGLIK